MIHDHVSNYRFSYLFATFVRQKPFAFITVIDVMKDCPSDPMCSLWRSIHMVQWGETGLITPVPSSPSHCLQCEAIHHHVSVLINPIRLFQFPLQHKQFKSTALPGSLYRWWLQRNLTQILCSWCPVTVTCDLYHWCFHGLSIVHDLQLHAASTVLVFVWDFPPPLSHEVHVNVTAWWLSRVWSCGKSCGALTTFLLHYFHFINSFVFIIIINWLAFLVYSLIFLIHSLFPHFSLVIQSRGQLTVIHLDFFFSLWDRGSLLLTQSQTLRRVVVSVINIYKSDPTHYINIYRMYTAVYIQFLWHSVQFRNLCISVVYLLCLWLV